MFSKMALQIVIKMKKILILIMLFFSYGSLLAQKSNSDHFYLDGKKYLKEVKYILFNPEIDTKKRDKENFHFNIQRQRFKYINGKHTIDTCNIKDLESVVLSKAIKLSEEEYQFHKNKIREIEDWEKKMFSDAMPISKTHLYFKIFVLEKINDTTIMKYEVDWEYSHSY